MDHPGPESETMTARFLVPFVSMASLLVVGCDVVVGVGLWSRHRNSDSDDSAATDPAYRVWIASLSDAAAAGAQQTVLIAAGGNPDPAVWSHVGSATATAEFDPAPPAASFNTILIQATNARNYSLDAVEILDGSGNVAATATGTTYSHQIVLPDNLLGPVDGATAATAAVSGSHAFLFFGTSTPIERFRVSAWAGPRASGDVEWTADWTDPGNETPGGMTVHPSGTIYVTVGEGSGPRDVRLLRFSSTGILLGSTDVALGVAATFGSHGVVHDASGNLIVTATTGDGDILTRKLDSALTPVWSVTFDSLLPGDRVETNGVASDGAGDVLVAGASATVSGVQHWIRKMSGLDGSPLWTQTPGLLDPATNTYWHSVTTGMSDTVHSAGDLTSLASTFVETFTRATSTGGVILSSDQVGDNDTPADRAQAIAQDGAGNVVVGGYFGTTSQSRNAVLYKYASPGFLVWLVTHDGPASGADEILDLVVDADNNIYVVGYESTGSQGENLWVRKISPSGSILWTRTYHGGGGNDRAISVALAGSTLLVAGFRTLSNGETDVHLRAYVR